MVKVLKTLFSVLFYGVCIFLLIGIISFFVGNRDRPLVNNLSHNEIVSSGYRYLVFGSQNSNGIELYDFESGRVIPFLIPKDKNIRYISPVVGKFGKGYCIKEDHIFNLERKEGEIIYFDLNTLQSRSTKVLIRQAYANLALSRDEKKLALIYILSSNSTPMLGIFNIAEEKIDKTFPIDKRFIENPIKILWGPDNKHVLIWDTITGLPTLEMNITTGHSRIIKDYPLDYKGKYMLAMDGRKENVYWQNLESEEMQIIVKKNATGHSFSLSKDGKYLIYGWLRGKGFETIVIMETKSRRKFRIKLNNHPGTVLGLALW